jgi:hypothetical protein
LVVQPGAHDGGARILAHFPNRLPKITETVKFKTLPNPIAMDQIAGKLAAKLIGPRGKIDNYAGGQQASLRIPLFIENGLCIG